ncbi:unnamed protein product, partial [Mesorhabditis belari]|uniref:Uncharacterized protein n=1 Tax=Mesorhabditis belari TaxID=2138241 RepID=A0AAF3ELW7_9BILA
MHPVSLVVVILSCLLSIEAFAFNEDRPQAFAFNGARGSDVAGRMFAFADSKSKRADPQRFAFANGEPMNEAAKFAFAFAKRDPNSESLQRFARAQKFAFEGNEGKQRFA